MAWLITVLAVLFVIAAAGAKRRASKRYDLPTENPALSLAILKESLLENPSSFALEKLKEFCALHNIELPKEEYPLGKAKELEQDDNLFSMQAQWLDFLTPLEFKEIPQTEKTIINAVLRLYSDEAIFKAFSELKSEEAKKLEQDYKNLCALRDESKADYDSLERLRIEKEKWDAELRAFV